MKQCNHCSNKKCDIIRMHRAKKRVLSAEEMQQSCEYWKPLRRYREKLLVLAIFNNTQEVHDVLYRHGFLIQELADYPYFKIITGRKTTKGKTHGHGRNRK